MSDLADLAWSARQLPVALVALARDAGLSVAGAPRSDLSEDAAHDDASRKAIGAALGLELEPVAIPYRDLGAALPRLGPAICFLRDDSGESVVLTLSPSRGRTAAVLDPNGRRVRIEHAELERLLAAPLEETCEAHVERVMGALGRAGRRTGDAVRDALRTHLLAGKRVTGCFVLRSRADCEPLHLAREARLGSSLAKLTVLHVVRYGSAIVG